MTESNDLSSPGEGRRLLWSQLASEAAANLLWRGAKGIAGDAWNLIKVPGQILGSERTPYPGRADSVDPAGYAAKLAMMGAGVRAPSLLTSGGAFDSTVLPSFFAWHGTGAKEPFEQFSREQLRGVHGEGGSPLAWNDIGFGHGFYFGQMRGTGEYYARQQDGSLLRVEVQPDEHELLDMNAPWRMQSDQVKERMGAAGLGPANPELSGFNWYMQAVRDRMNNLGEGTVQAEAAVSKLMEDAGVPGTKYLDQFSRGKGFDLTHKSEVFDSRSETPLKWTEAPGEQHPGSFGNVKTQIPAEDAADMGVGGAVSHVIDKLKTQKGVEGGAEGGASRSGFADWLEKEYKANPSDFSLKDNRTRNFVVFNPDNISIKTWGGRPLEGMPEGHNPFGELP